MLTGKTEGEEILDGRERSEPYRQDNRILSQLVPTEYRGHLVGIFPQSTNGVPGNPD